MHICELGPHLRHQGTAPQGLDHHINVATAACCLLTCQYFKAHLVSPAYEICFFLLHASVIQACVLLHRWLVVLLCPPSPLMPSHPTCFLTFASAALWIPNNGQESRLLHLSSMVTSKHCIRQLFNSRTFVQFFLTIHVMAQLQITLCLPMQLLCMC